MSTDTDYTDMRTRVRIRMRNLRKSLGSAEIARAEIACSAYTAPFLQHPRKIAGYLAIQGEMPVTTTLHYCRTRGSHTYVPMLNGETLMFAELNEHTPMITNRFGIEEPEIPKSDWLSPSDMDIVLVPLVAFDSNCNRMGMGGGYYDKSFAYKSDKQTPPLLIGVAHAFQEVQCVYPQWWDIPLDRVVTDEGVLTP